MNELGKELNGDRLAEAAVPCLGCNDMLGGSVSETYCLHHGVRPPLPPMCPRCSSRGVYHDGDRAVACYICGHRDYSGPITPLPTLEDVGGYRGRRGLGPPREYARRE